MHTENANIIFEKKLTGMDTMTYEIRENSAIKDRYISYFSTPETKVVGATCIVESIQIFIPITYTKEGIKGICGEGNNPPLERSWEFFCKEKEKLFGVILNLY